MYQRSQNIRNFFFSQYLADGIRTTLEIILPAFICAEFEKLDLGITISIGALCVSIADAPGPVKHKRNGMLYCNIFIFIMALLTGFVNHNAILLGLLIIVASFFFTMFTIYGNRATSIGTAALLVMVLRMAHVTDYSKAITDSFFILSGGVWYMLVALLFYRFTPYRPAQRSLGECIHETAKYLRIKSALYESNANIENEYRKLVVQQVEVNEKQDAVRELLYKNRTLLKESISNGRKLVLTFVDLIDLFEHIIATWYDYASLHKKFSDIGVLNDISAIIKNIADELDNIAFAIQSNLSYKKKYDQLPDLEKLKVTIDELEKTNSNSVFILKKILINLRNIGERVDALDHYFDDSFVNRKMRNENYYSRFVTHQKIDATLFINNLTLNSSVFRHSLRMTITCGVGFIVSRFLPNGHHSYWLLLTIIVILKPGFSLTKQRNFERFAGTLAGGLIGLLLLAFIHDRFILFFIIVFLMIGTYTFQRLNYIVMVIFLTPYLLILFNFLGVGFVNVAEERLLDTAIGSALSLMASYLLFPSWESNQLNNYMENVLKANIDYLNKISEYFFDEKKFISDYKLIRKEVFLSTANLSAAFNRMLSEPKSKQRHGKEIYEFVVLNHTLSSNIAGLIAANIIPENNVSFQNETLQSISSSIYVLKDSLEQLEKNNSIQNDKLNIFQSLNNTKKSGNQFFEQLDFIYKLAIKINKVITAIAR